MDGRVMEKAPAETRGFTDLRIQNFRRTLDQLQDRASSVLLLTLQWKEIEEQFDLSRNEIEVREKEVNAMKESVNGQILELDKREERLSKVEARQKELDSVIEEKLKDLEEKEKEFGLKQDEFERKKVEFDLKIKRKDEEFELKEKKLEERSKEFELKEKKLEEQAKEFVLGKKKLDERAKELELKERELEERSKKLTSPRENSRPEVEPSISLLTKHVGFSASMDYENQTRDDDDDLMNNRTSLALQILSLDPAKRVLDAVQGVYQPHLKMSDGRADKSVSIKSCIVLLEKLMKMNPKIEPEVKGEAIKLSIDWFNEVATNPENEMEVLGCFLFLAVYCLASAFTPQLLFNLLEHTTLYDQSPKLFQLLGFKDKASGVVETPIEKEVYFAAIKFICEFRISAKFRPSCLLQRYLNSSEKAARRIVGTGNSPEVQRTFGEIQKADAVVALEYIKEKKCEKIFPIKILESSIDALEKQLASQNTTVPTQGCKKRSQAHQSNDKHHSLSEGTGLSATGASISSEEPGRANKHQRTTEPTGVKIKESTENHHLKTTVPSASSSPSTEPKPSVPFDNINRDVSGVPVEKHCTEEETALSNALRCSPDPAKLVLDTVMVLHPSNLEGDFEFKLRVSPNKCFLFLDQLKKLSPQIEDQVKDEAKKLAILWKFKLSKNNKSDHLEILCFLLFLGIYKVVSEFKADELLHLLDNAQSLSPDLCHFLGLANEIPRFIQNLIKTGERLKAINYIFALDMVERFPPVPILRDFLKSYAYEPTESSLKNAGGLALQVAAINKKIKALGDAVKCIEHHKLKSQFDVDSLHERIRLLFKQKSGLKTQPDGSKPENKIDSSNLQAQKALSDSAKPQTQKAKPDSANPQTQQTKPDSSNPQTQKAIPDSAKPQTQQTKPDSSNPQTQKAIPDLAKPQTHKANTDSTRPQKTRQTDSANPQTHRKDPDSTKPDSMKSQTQNQIIKPDSGSAAASYLSEADSSGKPKPSDQGTSDRVSRAQQGNWRKRIPKRLWRNEQNSARYGLSGSYDVASQTSNYGNYHPVGRYTSNSIWAAEEYDRCFPRNHISVYSYLHERQPPSGYDLHPYNPYNPYSRSNYQF